MGKPNIFEVAIPSERNILQLGDVQHEVRPLRLSAFFDLADQIQVIQDPKSGIKEKFAASVAMLLLCVPTLTREALDALSFGDFQKVTDFVMEIALKHTEKTGLASPFSEKPSPSGDSSGSGSATSPNSAPESSAS